MTVVIAKFVWVLGLLAWVAIRLPYQHRSRKIKIVRDGRTFRDRLALATATAGLSIVPLIFVATGWPAAADFTFHPILGWIGVFVELLFLAVFYESHRQLGKNWSVTLEIRDKHKLVTDGLYRYVRHPMYSSFWLWGLAQLLLLPNVIAGTAGLLGVAVLYFSRVSHEESLMRDAFGLEYDTYAARTGRIIPKAWGKL